MKRALLLPVASILLATFVSAQDPGSHEELLSSDLVAWTGMQQPQQPEQQPGQKAPNSEAPRPAQQQSDASNSASSHAPTASDFTGTVTREGNDFVLKVSETTTYKLDAKHQIEQYEGQRVRVTGTLDSGVNVIHVDRIEPIS